MRKLFARRFEGEPRIFRFAPVGLEKQLLFMGDVIEWDLRVFDRTQRRVPEAQGLGTIKLVSNPLPGQWVRVDDGRNANITYEFVASGAASNPYFARPVVLTGGTIEQDRDALQAAMTAEFLAGTSSIIPLVSVPPDTTDTVQLRHDGDIRNSKWPVVKQGNSMEVTGMSPGSHYEITAQPPSAVMYATKQTSTEDGGWDDDLGGYTFRYDFINSVAPLLGGHRYDFEFKLHTVSDGIRMIVATVGVIPVSSPV